MSGFRRIQCIAALLKTLSHDPFTASGHCSSFVQSWCLKIQLDVVYCCWALLMNDSDASNPRTWPEDADCAICAVRTPSPPHLCHHSVVYCRLCVPVCFEGARSCPPRIKASLVQSVLIPPKCCPSSLSPCACCGSSRYRS